MDKFYNLATGQVDEVNPSKVTAALGLSPWKDEDGNPADVVPGQVKPTHTLIKEQKYSFFSPEVDKYDAKSAEDYLSALQEGALPWDPILQDAWEYKKELRSGNFFTSREKAKGYISKALTGVALGLPEIGQTAYAAQQAAIGDTADARATLLKKAILDEELGAAGSVVEFLGALKSLPVNALTKTVSKGLEKYAASAFAKSLENKLVSKAAANVVTRGVAGAVEAGGVTAIEKASQALVPQTEEEFADPSTIAEHVIARLANVPGQSLESAQAGAAFGAGIRAAGELPGLAKATVSSSITPLWKAVAGIINSKGESVGDFADALGANQFIPKGAAKVEQLQGQIGEAQFEKSVSYIKQIWDKDIVKRALQTADDTVNVIKDSLGKAHEKMNSFVDKVSKSSGLAFDLDDVLKRAQIDLQTEVPKGAWNQRENSISALMNRIINKDLKAGYSDQVVQGTGFNMTTAQPRVTLEKLKQLKSIVDEKANYAKPDPEASFEELAYRKISRAIEAHTLDTLDSIGKTLNDTDISAKAYKEFKLAQGALKMAFDTAKNKKDSMWQALPLAASGAVTALLVQGLLGADLASPQSILTGMLGSSLGMAYGRNVAAKSLKFLHDAGVSGQMAIAESANRFAKLTPSAVKDKGESALRLLGAREIAGLFNAPDPTKTSKERYMIGVNSALSEWTSNPNALAESVSNATDAIADAAPNTTAEIQKTMANALQWLQTQTPKPNDMSAIGLSEYHVSDAQVDEFNQKATAVFSPSLVIQNIQNGTATGAQLQALKAAYPKVYESIQQDFATAAAQNPNVNTLTKKDLGLVLGKPVTTAMQKRYLDLLQQNYTKQDGPGRPKNTSSMQSLGSMFQTETNRVVNRNNAQ